MVELDNPLTRVNRAQFIVDHLGLEPGMSVLDAGCGPGQQRLYPGCRLLVRCERSYPRAVLAVDSQVLLTR
jgi:hypothetical protein